MNMGKLLFLVAAGDDENTEATDGGSKIVSFKCRRLLLLITANVQHSDA